MSEDKEIQNGILYEIVREREHQDRKWGGPDHDDTHEPYAWVSFITVYLGQAISYTSVYHSDKSGAGNSEVSLRMFRYNMVKVAALAVAAIETIDRMLSKDK